MIKEKIDLNLILMTTLISLFIPNIAAADPTNLINVNVVCPRTKLDGGTNARVILNNGVIISGFGQEFVNGKETANPLFASATPPGVPNDFNDAGYYRSDTDYDPFYGRIICHYTSSLGLPKFSLSYTLANGSGGTVKYKTPKSIYVSFLVGFKK